MFKRIKYQERLNNIKKKMKLPHKPSLIGI